MKYKGYRIHIRKFVKWKFQIGRVGWIGNFDKKEQAKKAAVKKIDSYL